MRRIVISVLGAVLALDLLVVGGAFGADDHRPGSGATTTSTTTSTMPSGPTTTSVPATLPAETTSTTTGTSRPVEAPADPYFEEPIRTIGRIEIPKLGLAADLGEGISLRNIDRGPSHWPGTAMPGQNGNVVVAGHRVSRTRPFRYIDRLVPGDEVWFEVAGARWRYVVTGSEVVTPDRIDIVNQTPDPTATLFACHPPGSARFRYVVHLKLA